MRAFIYVRQSINHQEGIERGIAKAGTLVTARDWVLAHPPWIDNATSASKSRDIGTQWSLMLEAIRRKEADVIVGVDLDRLVRGIRDLQTLIDLGVRVVTVDGEIDLTTADGEFRATMLAGIARFEVRRKGERQRRANDHRISQGLPVAGGRRRFGFESDHITVRKAEAKWVRHLYREVAKGKSLGSVSRTMNEKKVPCVTKGLWNPPRLRKILVNPAYRGYVIHHGVPHESDSAPVIVDPKLAARVDAIMADPTRLKSPGNERSALLGGIARCGTCEAPLISAGTKSRGVMIKTYACSAVKGKQTAAAGHPSIRRKILDDAVRHEVFSAFMSGSAEMALMPVAGDLALIEAGVADLIFAKADLIAGVDPATGVTMADIRPQLLEVERRRENLEAERLSIITASAHAQMLQAARHSLFTSGSTVSIDDAAGIWRTIKEGFDAMDLDTQRNLIRDLLDIHVSAGRGLARVSIWHKIVLSLNDESAA